MVEQQATSVICPRTGTSSSIPLSLLHPKVIRLRAVSLHPIWQRQLLCAIHHPHRSPWNRGTQENLLPNFRHLHSRLVSCWNHLRLWYQQAISLIANPISGQAASILEDAACQGVFLVLPLQSSLSASSPLPALRPCDSPDLFALVPWVVIPKVRLRRPLFMERRNLHQHHPRTCFMHGPWN